MAKKKADTNDGGIKIVAVNKSGRRDYEVIDTFEAGIVLRGSEVKSVRDGAVNLKESYVRVLNEEIFLIGCNISPYSHAPVDAHAPTRERKLLLHKREIEKLIGQVEQKGLSLFPLKMYFKNGKAKLEIALGKGKKHYDKREDVKKREAEREIERAFKVKR